MEARQTVPPETKPSAGQVVVLPVHCSTTSQPPADGRQVVDDGRKFGVHVAVEPTLPVQVS
jgi:hypothetical protein